MTACGVSKLKSDGGGGGDLHILMVAALILKKEFRLSDKLWPSIWGGGRCLLRAKDPSPLKDVL